MQWSSGERPHVELRAHVSDRMLVHSTLLNTRWRQHEYRQDNSRQTVLLLLILYLLVPMHITTAQRSAEIDRFAYRNSPLWPTHQPSDNRIKRQSRKHLDRTGHHPLLLARLVHPSFFLQRPPTPSDPTVPDTVVDTMVNVFRKEGQDGSKQTAITKWMAKWKMLASPTHPPPHARTETQSLLLLAAFYT